MKKAARVLMIYLLSLLLFSLLFSWLGIANFQIPVSKFMFPIMPMMMVTILGGIIALKFVVPPYSFKMFLIVYSCLWLLRHLIYFVGNQIGTVVIMNRTFKFEQIISQYYENASRLGTPWPFVVFWFINYLYSNQQNNSAINKKN